MLKVCCIEMMYAMGPVVKERLYEEVCSLVKSHDYIEFWFTGCHWNFEKLLMKYILELRKAEPASRLDIVAVIDPIKEEQIPMESPITNKDGYPPEAVTRVEYAPRIIGKSEKNPNRFIAHCMKIDRWVMEQCDVLLAFHYEGIPSPTNTEIKWITKRTGIRLVSIFDPNVAARLNNTIEKMDGRDGEIMRSLCQGRTYHSVGEEFGISLHRVKQIAYRVLRHFFADVRSEFGEYL